MMQVAESEVSPGLKIALRIIKGSLAAQASDIHLRSGVPPFVRVEGELCPLEHPELETSTVREAITTLGLWAGVPPDRLGGRQVEFACAVPQVGRFRCHVYHQRGTPALVLRHIRHPVPEPAALRLPPVVKQIALAERGLVLVTGATGNGKSTTIASMLQFINSQAPKHIVTIEEPIEYLFDDEVSTFSQREVGRDVDSFGHGLTGALREDPDVIFLGEIRNLDEFDVALSAAESGHMVISTLHSSDSSGAITRMMNLYPPDFRGAARARIADALTAIVSQKLVAQRGGRERILVTEILRNSGTVQDCIREPSRFRQLPQVLDQGLHEHGTYSFDSQLLQLVKSGAVSVDTARAAARSPKDLVRNLKVTR